MADAIYIEDGFQRSHDIAARPGLYPAVRVEYRPALARERLVYAARLDTKDPDAVETYQSELIAKQVVALNGKPVTPVQARRLEPNIRGQVLDLILGYTEAQEQRDLGN